MLLTRRQLLGAGLATAAAAALPWHSGALEAGQAAMLGGVAPASAGGPVVTTCNLCPLGCTVLATREGDRVVRLSGHPGSPVNEGRLCAKGHAGLYKAIHPERLGHPLVRAGARGEGRWKRVSWDHALGTVAASLGRIRRVHGPQSIALWQNLNMDRPDIFQRFVHALGSPNFIGHISTCDASRLLGGAMTYGASRAVYDYAHAECIVAVGINPLGAKDLVHAAREILGARERGATLVTVDPRLSETAARSDLWLPIRPGTDGVLLAGLGRWLIENDRIDHAFLREHTFGFETIRRHLAQFDAAGVCRVTGIAPEQFLRAANAMARRRSVVAVGRGVVTHRDATDAVRMAEVVNALLGAFDREGGVRLMPYPPVPLAEVQPAVKDPGGERIDRANGGRLPLPVGLLPEYPAAFFGVSHEVPRNILREDPYPLRALVFNAVNPVYSLPQGEELVAALDEVDLVVSIDAFASETTRYADVVLPASTYLEGLDLWFPAPLRVSLRQPVIRPRLESRPSQEIILALAKTMGLEKEFPFARYEDFVRAQLAGTGISLDELRRRGFVEWSAPAAAAGELRRKGFVTPSGRVELVSSLLAASGYALAPRVAHWPEPEDDDAFPLHLVTFKLPFHTQSATAENPYLAAIQSDNPLWMNPETASRLGVATGDAVVVESRRGTIEARVRVSAGIRPDTVALAHHFGHTAYATTAVGRGVNAKPVVGDGTDPVGGNLAFNDTRVRVRRA